MANNPTQRYVDNEKSKSFLTSILNQEPVGVVEEVDIDLDVEKKISELQEAKLNGKSVNAGKELKEWNWVCPNGYYKVFKGSNKDVNRFCCKK